MVGIFIVAAMQYRDHPNFYFDFFLDSFIAWLKLPNAYLYCISLSKITALSHTTLWTDEQSDQE